MRNVSIGGKGFQRRSEKGGLGLRDTERKEKCGEQVGNCLGSPGDVG